MSSCVSGISSHYRAAFHAGGWCAVCLAVHQCGDTGFRDISRFGGSYISRLLQPGVNKAVMEETYGTVGTQGSHLTQSRWRKESKPKRASWTRHPCIK